MIFKSLQSSGFFIPIFPISVFYVRFSKPLYLYIFSDTAFPYLFWIKNWGKKFI